MSDSNIAGRPSGSASDIEVAKIRSRAVKPGHLEVGEFTSGHIGASSPFGKSAFPLPARTIHYEYTGPVATRILEDERH
ncbi:hypothetical protein [Glycomyces rhizosphaerae]|uniref:Uncharacterized protein n=1 Tax=Glycomyces rhizosphaerae TaxID=2054422 RepID=A0ABV7Q0V0_9ACTN